MFRLTCCRTLSVAFQEPALPWGPTGMRCTRVASFRNETKKSSDNGQVAPCDEGRTIKVEEGKEQSKRDRESRKARGGG